MKNLSGKNDSLFIWVSFLRYARIEQNFYFKIKNKKFPLFIFFVENEEEEKLRKS